MAGFSVEFFKGIRPRVSAKKLPNGEAQTAQNAKLGSGDLKAWYEKDAGTPVVNTYYNRTIFNYDNNGSPIWLEFDDDVDVARGPIKGDTLERVYYTGDTRGTGAPRMTFNTIADGGGGGPYPEDFRYLGVPEPANPPTASANDLPETNDAEDRLISSGECDAFIIDTVEWTVYPGTGTRDQTWDLNSGALGSIAFEMTPGTALKVKEVPASNKVTLVSADNEAIALRTVNADKTTVNDWKPFDEGGSTQEADFLGWIIPEMTFTTPTDHLLRVGDVITITTGRGADAWLQWFASAGQTVYEQSWEATPDAEYESGATVYRERNARISASATEGSTKFTLTGDFYYDVDRLASDNDVIQDRQYVYTQVTALGEEGPPSDPSNVVLALEGDTVTLDNLPVTTDAGYDIDFIRIYRTNASAAGTEFQFVKEYAPGSNAQNPTSETVATENLGEVLSTTTWFKPDKDMKGITTLPNGMMAGFKGKNLYLCEPYFPHAWPPEYDQAVDFEIVGIASFGNALAILTEGHPYLMTGSHPRNVNVRPLKLKQSCVSKKSIATDKDRVFYASPDGLVELGVNGAKLVTIPYVKKEEWASYSPSTLVGAFHDNNYYGFFDGEGNIPVPLVSVAVTGTALTADEDDIRAGGNTIILTLTGDTWVASGATFDAVRQDIIDAIAFKPDLDGNDWDTVISTLAVTDVARTSDTVVTITLPAVASFAIDEAQTVTMWVPGSALTLVSSLIGASPSFTIQPAAALTGFNLFVGSQQPSSPYNIISVVSNADASQYVEYIVDSGNFTDLNDVTYSPSLGRWAAAGENAAGKIAVYTSDDDGETWAERDLDDPDSTSGDIEFIYRNEKFGFFLATGYGSFFKRMQYSQDGLNWSELRVLDNEDVGTQVGRVVYGGDRVYAETLGAPEAIAISPDLTVDPITDFWTTVSVTGIDAIESGEGVVIYADGDVLRYITHGALTTSAIGTLGTTVSGTAALVFGADIWVLFGTNFKVAVCDAVDNPLTIGDWTTYGFRDAGATGTYTVLDAWYDKGSDGVNGLGFCVLLQGAASTFFRELYTSPDGVTWTKRNDWVQYDYLRGGASKYEPTEDDRD